MLTSPGDIHIILLIKKKGYAESRGRFVAFVKKKKIKGSGMEKNLKMNLSLMSTFLYFYQRTERNPWLTPVMVAADEGVRGNK